ncbi:DUF2231 domain-containing protein [Micromonospora sp. NPDC049523]|uniref:DUF2231 domain-containing protein n=1 Tax=Micromonospora sp. NPDC049523 TaxID=3155921 RepID=UPI00341D6862
MFLEIMGLPVHPLVVHAAVVFVPLLVLLAIGYGILPRFRAKTGWAVAILAVLAPASALFAKLSGEELLEALIAKGYPPPIVAQLTEHQEYGDLLFWFSLGLGIVTGLLLYVTSARASSANLPRWVALVLTGLVIVFGVLSAVYVYLTGDSGAQVVWNGVL